MKLFPRVSVPLAPWYTLRAVARKLEASQTSVVYSFPADLIVISALVGAIISRLTVNAHVRSIYSELNVSSHSAATRYVIEHRLT